jgi:hypothetical protein
MCRCENGRDSQYEKVKIYNKGTAKKSGKISSQKMSKRERKRLNRMKKKKTCAAPGLNCFLHTNHHWKTEPLWKSMFQLFLLARNKLGRIDGRN